MLETQSQKIYGEQIVEGASSLFSLILPVGEFYLEVSSMAAAVVSQDSCPSFRMEAAVLSRDGSASHYMDALKCNEVYQGSIPAFTGLPYEYDQKETVLFRGVPGRKEPIFAFDFEPTEDAIFTFTLLNDFLDTDLSAQLVNHGEATNSSSSESENERSPLKTYSYNALDVTRELSAGSSYTLEIYAADDVYGRLDCVGFALALNIRAKKDNEQVCAGSEQLASSLDTIQFLRPPLNSFHFKNDNLAVPDFSANNLAFSKTVFTSPLDQPSVFRLFLSYESIDVTVELRDMNTFEVVASSEGVIYDDDEGASPSVVLRALLYPGTSYEIQYAFANTELEPLECLTFSLEMTLHPAPEADVECPHGGGDHWGSSSLGGTTTMDGLYYQQILGEKREHTYQLAKQTSSFDLFVQLNFDFSEGQLEMVLKDTDNGFVIRSVEGLNSAVVTASDLPAGTYTLTVKEVSTPLPGFVGCSEFSLFFQAQKASASLSLLTTPPETLDRLPFLEYSSEVNLQGPLVLPVGETKVSFKTKDTSNLRVVAYAHETALEALTLLLSPSSGARTTMQSEGGWEYMMLEAELEPNTEYHLAYDVSEKDESLVKLDVLSVFSALSIVPSTHFSDPATCTKPTVIPPISINEELESYMWSSSVKYPITPEVERTIISTLDISVKVPSKIFVSAEFNFPIDEIVLELYDCDCEQDGGIGSLLVRGSRYFDQSSLDEVVEPGTYHLRIVSVQPKDSLYSWQERCAEFDLFISIHESTSDFSVCSSLDTLPSNLNDAEGTERYGGPMDEEGYLHLSYPRFYVDTTPGVIETQITITEESYVSVYVTSPSVVVVETELHVKKTSKWNSNGKIVSVPAVQSNSSEGMAFMVAKTGGKKTKEHTLSIYFGALTKFSGCPYFGVDIKVFPVKELRKEIVCEEWETLGFGEDHRLQIGDDGVGRYGGADYFLWKDLDQVRELHFDITQESLLTMSVGFDSLISTWSVTLEKPSSVGEDGGEVIVEESSSLLAYEETSSQVNLYTTLTSSLTEPGRYILRMTRNVWDKKNSPSGSTCEPQLWSLLVVPESALLTRALVYRVEPSQALGVSPEGEVKVVVEFSSEIYSEIMVEKVGNETIVVRKEATGEDVLNAFVLKSVDDSVEEEKPLEEEEADSEKEKEHVEVEPLLVEGEGRYWVLTFDELPGGRKFVLELNEGSLYAEGGEGAILVGDHYYSTLDPECGGRGEEKVGAGFCLCEEGYAGRTCRECAQGWELVGREEGGRAMCEEVQEVEVGGWVSGFVLVVTLVGLVVVWVKKRRADPFRGAFSWEEEKGGTLLSEEGLDGDAMVIDEEGGKGLFDGLGGDSDEEEEEGAGNGDFFLSSSSEESF